MIENISYIHLASIHEASENIELAPVRFKYNFFVFMRLLPIALSLIVLNSAQQALALERGDNGPQVRNIQQCLQRLGFFNGPITGNFGPLTEEAVRRFQRAYSIDAIGRVGPQTQRALNSACQTRATTRSFTTSTPTVADRFPNALNQGDGGPQVTQLQVNLQQLGYLQATPTGYFGTSTTEAVRRFQQDNGLLANGIADAQTVALISRAVRPSSTANCSPDSGYICFGENSSRVSAVQQNLRDRGFFVGEITGYYGSATQNAVSQFQRSAGLSPSGIVDFSTWQALGLANGATPGVASPASGNRYVVVIPIFDADTLNRVRQYVPQAVAAKSRLGDYVNAGAFRDRSAAQKLSNLLRDQGLDARVEYF